MIIFRHHEVVVLSLFLDYDMDVVVVCTLHVYNVIFFKELFK